MVSRTGTLLSVVIPCYNEEQVLPLLYERVSAAAQTWALPYEVILVDDGSHDGSWGRMQDIHDRDPRWKMVALARNFGHQTALWAGLHLASGDVIAVLDADLQDPPEILPKFLEKWQEGYDVVYAVRQTRPEGRVKRAAYAAFYRILSVLSDTAIPLDAGDFCVMDRRVLDVLKTMPERNRFVRGLRAWVGFRQIALPYDRGERAAGEAKYTFRKLMQLAFDGLLSFSAHPLRLATYFGILVSGLSVVMVCFTLAQRLFSEQFARWGLAPVPGFATIVISIFFLGGVQLMCLGLLGEYLGRVYEDVKHRPMWVSRAALGVDDPLSPRSGLGGRESLGGTPAHRERVAGVLGRTPHP
jgi:glycosyltransferase involved in cell wall biosynthesis